ncbi:hypothetical protein [Campylobacter vicugnae]|uniref:hypothetical protein n=1 Tax=Campylobacter vicugnae TaxID=1660076 RepID=UPI0025505483|nr:hypothetical protein [Campylobacter ovis]MDL0105227.1 hypothetical protein [Campylobacter ovis]MDL0106646.1 hypothetical protein [Campylobacter ovis]
MLLSAGALELKDIDGNVISGVSGNYFNKFSATLTKHGQTVSLPITNTGIKGLLIVKTTAILGHQTVNSRSAYLNRSWVVAPGMGHRAKGAVYKYTYTLNSIPQEFILEENQNGSWVDKHGTYNVEILLYY